MDEAKRECLKINSVALYCEIVILYIIKVPLIVMFSEFSVSGKQHSHHKYHHDIIHQRQIIYIKKYLDGLDALLTLYKLYNIKYIIRKQQIGCGMPDIF